MANVVLPVLVMDAGNAPAFVLADLEVAEILAALAPFTAPSRFQALLFSLAALPEGLPGLKKKHARLRAAFHLTLSK
jgi:hypothetical protein